MTEPYTPDENMERTVFTVALMRGIENVLGEEWGSIRNEAIKKLDARKDEVIAGLVLNIKKSIDVNTVGSKTVITVMTDRFDVK